MLYREIFKKPKHIPVDISLRSIIAAAVCIALVSVIYIGKTPYGGQPQAGKVADRDIYAPMDFSFNAGVDEEKTSDMKNKAAMSVKDVYDIDPSVKDNAAQDIRALFSAANELRTMENISADEKISRARPVNKFGLSDGDLKTLLQSQDTAKSEPILLKQADGMLSQAIISPEEKESLKKQGKGFIKVRDISGKTEADADVKSL
ncbi:MAG: hypothetical protein PHE80_02525, partial [Candidatus Omnitrophica bacterium]|nr:hypothetical protein [Candidatus Omnitrophota bacterium]